MTARDAILKAVETTLGPDTRTAQAITAAARALLDDADAVRPSLPVPSCVESFVQRVGGPKVAATVDRVSVLDDLPAAVARYLAFKGLEARVALQPTNTLANLDWNGAGVRLDIRIDDGVVVGLALWGIAETGSLVFHSAADMPILYNFLAATHVVAVHASRIVPFLEDYAAAARIFGDPAPRNACLITGPSGTTDIEGSLVRGAHGPRDLHVVVIDDRKQPVNESPEP
jgi:L-lactate dehydrogenase complex protein LldG